VKRRQLLEAACAVAFATPGCRGRSAAEPRRGIVSLAPAITETLFTIGAGAQVIAISDYCDYPPAALALPRVGTSITPNYEAIARLNPAQIIGESNASTRRRELEALAPTELLPWLNLHEVCASIERLGALAQRREEANRLARTVRARLDVPEPSGGPRVLLLLGGEGASNELWFVRRNSLHGSVLRAAGACNAIAEDVNGPPQLSHERLLSVNPELIVILSRPGAARAARDGFERFPTLSAVKRGKVGVVESSDAFANGPRILRLVDQLRAELVRLGAFP
jgi:iron complex transport system substrate-binding protein